jgi:hypothetical protein
MAWTAKASFNSITSMPARLRNVNFHWLPAGEEQLGRREDHIVFLNAQYLLGVQLTGHSQVAVQMLDPLGRTGGAGGVQPEGDVVAAGRSRLEVRGCLIKQVVQARPPVIGLAGHDHLLKHRIRGVAFGIFLAFFCHTSGFRSALSAFPGAGLALK